MLVHVMCITTAPDKHLVRVSSTGGGRDGIRVALPRSIDPSTIHAGLADGVLEIIVPNGKVVAGPGCARALPCWTSWPSGKKTLERTRERMRR